MTASSSATQRMLSPVGALPDGDGHRDEGERGSDLFEPR
jgi:hypothetical protein